MVQEENAYVRIYSRQGFIVGMQVPMTPDEAIEKLLGVTFKQNKVLRKKMYPVSEGDTDE